MRVEVPNGAVHGLFCRNFAAGLTGTVVARMSEATSGAGVYEPNRSLGGAISVTRSRMSFLFGSGVSVIWRGSSRAVQA
jgi:hypothetical protein